MTDPACSDATTYPPAELDRRFYAFVLDRLLGWGVVAGAAFLSYRSLIEPGDVALGVAVVVAAVVLVGVLAALLVGLVGLSPGKALVGLRVVGAETGAPIGVPRALLRGVVLGVAALPTLGIGVATLAWTAVMDPGRQRRGWHDHVSGAVVVDVRPVPVLEEVVEERPRQVVNLTAMRLVPAAPAPATVAVPTPQRLPRPSAPPSGPRTAAPPPAAPPPAAPPPVAPPPVPAALPSSSSSLPAPSTPPPAAAPRVSQLGPPLVAAPRAQEAAPPPSAQPAPAPPVPVPPVPVPPVPAQPASPQPAPVPRWRVSFDTGETLVVEGLALVGRRPEARAGESVSHLLPLRSSDMSLSKTHAQFQVTPSGALVVMDRGSTNGSVVIRQGVSKALTPGRPATLLAGDKVCFGDRQMTVEPA